MGEKLVLSVREVAESLGVHPNTIYRLVETGGIPHGRVGHRIVISRAWRDQFVASLDHDAPTLEAVS